MSVNEGEDDEYQAFLANMPGKNTICPEIDTATSRNSPAEVAQQTTEEGLCLPVGSIVRWSHGNKMKVCSILETNLNDDDNNSASKVRALNSNTEIMAPFSSLTCINNPEPLSRDNTCNTYDKDDG